MLRDFHHEHLAASDAETTNLCEAVSFSKSSN